MKNTDSVRISEDELIRKMARNNYAAQLAGLGYGPDGMALPHKESNGESVPLRSVCEILAEKDLSVTGEPLRVKMTAEDWEKIILMWMEEEK